MRHSLIGLAILCGLGLPICVANAEPTRRISYLMNEPMTLFDWGLQQLTAAMNSVHLKDGPKLMIMTNYDWDKNRIKISAYSFENSMTRTNAKKWCRETINAVRSHLLINPKTGEPLLGDSSVLARYFAHDGFEKKNRPKGVGKELDDITEISGTFMLNSKSNKKVVCQGPLRSTKILFGQ